jgi:hypothetical protein
MPTQNLTLSQRTGTGQGLGLSGRGNAGAAMANVDLNRFLRAFKQIVVTGGAANAALTATGIEVGDQIIGVVAVSFQDLASPIQGPVQLSELSTSTIISAANQIKVSSSTADKTLLVTFIDLT